LETQKTVNRQGILSKKTNAPVSQYPMSRAIAQKQSHKNILQSHSNKNSMVLAQKQIKASGME
jgi:hypothetical protein